MADALAVKEDSSILPGFGSSEKFELLQRQAKLLASSPLVPKEYQGNLPNVVIAIELAGRIGASPLSIMQNLHIIHGKPSWSSQFVIAAVNSTGKFSPLRFAMEGKDMSRTCCAWAMDKATNERLEGPKVSMEMAKKEGWLDKSGSKWKTMPELMLRYRAAAFFGRLYAPEVLNGMSTADEVIDITYANPAPEVILPEGETKASQVIKAAAKEVTTKGDDML